MGKLPDTINKHQQPGRAHSTPSPSDSISHLNHQQFILSDNFSGLNQVFSRREVLGRISTKIQIWLDHFIDGDFSFN